MIVGVVADAKYNTFRDAPARALFLPFTQAPPRPVMTFVVRPAGDQRQAISAVDGRHRQARPAAEGQGDAAGGSGRRPRWASSDSRRRSPAASRCSRCACRAPASTRRSRSPFPNGERSSPCAARWAPRLATSARPVMRGPLRVALTGIVVAVPCAYALMRAMSALLFGVSPFDLRMVVGLRAGTDHRCGPAAALPAWRASTIDPHECLKAQ